MEGDNSLTQTFSQKCLNQPEQLSDKDYEKDEGKSDEPGEVLDKTKIEYFDSLGSKNSDKIKIVYVGKVKEVTDKQSVNEKETECKKHEISPKEILECRECGEIHEIRKVNRIYKNANKVQEAKLIRSGIMKISHENFLPKESDEADIKRNNATPFGDSHNPESLFKEPIKESKIELPKKASNILKDRKLFLNRDEEDFKTVLTNNRNRDKSSSKSYLFQLYEKLMNELASNKAFKQARERLANKEN